MTNSVSHIVVNYKEEQLFLIKKTNNVGLLFELLFNKYLLLK